MPCISGNYTPAVGVLCQVAVLDPSNVAAIQASTAPCAPTPNLDVFMALVDTGASATCISDKVIAKVGLQPSGKVSLMGATGASTVDQYTFHVGIAYGTRQVASGAITGQLNVNLVQGSRFTDHGFGFDVLLGRDVLCKGSLTVSYDGRFVFCF